MIRIALAFAVVVFLATPAHGLDYTAMTLACEEIKEKKDEELCIQYVSDAIEFEHLDRARHARAMANLSVWFPQVWELSDEILNAKKPRR